MVQIFIWVINSKFRFSLSLLETWGYELVVSCLANHAISIFLLLLVVSTPECLLEFRMKSCGSNKQPSESWRRAMGIICSMLKRRVWSGKKVPIHLDSNAPSTGILCNFCVALTVFSISPYTSAQQHHYGETIRSKYETAGNL